MTSLPGTVIPSPLRIVLTVLARLTIPMLGFAVAGIWLFDDKDSALIIAGAGLCVLAWFTLLIAGTLGRVLEFARERCEREQALIATVDRLSGAPIRPQRAVRGL